MLKPHRWYCHPDDKEKVVKQEKEMRARLAEAGIEVISIEENPLLDRGKVVSLDIEAMQRDFTPFGKPLFGQPALPHYNPFLPPNPKER